MILILPITHFYEWEEGAERAGYSNNNAEAYHHTTFNNCDTITSHYALYALSEVGAGGGLQRVKGALCA